MSGSGQSPAGGVSRVEAVHDVHPLDDLCNWREALLIQRAVVPIVDEDLARACVGAAHREREPASSVACLHGVVLDGACAPLLVDFRVGSQAELDHEVLHDAVEAALLEVLARNQLQEAVRAEGG
eukprot:CAMPEP_0168439536 /NCGR_PEP_ID=MMETSP0228-20121227/42516_1 /TAXON_ID=133427 /ORGANISM="Protoceratium reticulatum, Strain CCCM 535 (=CCMP 1889)" /LENGTH=124 /DNA_ID=CAMNT_0008453815 /DNA_START=145 /DNA_END=517 /DNA_ORIENTATION=-